MKNIFVILALAGCSQLAIMANAKEIIFTGTSVTKVYFNEQDTTMNKRQANPKNKRSNARDSISMPPDIRTDTASVPSTPFDTLSNPSRQKRI